MRKRTTFKLCDTHSYLGGGRRTAEIFAEGGPAYGSPCRGEHCVMLPGTDIFLPDVTDDMAKEWVRNWPVNSYRLKRAE